MTSTVIELEAAHVSPEQLAALNEFAAGLGKSELRDLLFGLTVSVQNGSDVTLLEASAELTPAQVASKLKMSRTHLYKLLDRGEIPSHRVGRDRRILTSDVMTFEAARQNDRRALAERFARAGSIRAAALDELVEDDENG